MTRSWLPTPPPIPRTRWLPAGAWEARTAADFIITDSSDARTGPYTADLTFRNPPNYERPADSGTGTMNTRSRSVASDGRVYGTLRRDGDGGPQTDEAHRVIRSGSTTRGTSGKTAPEPFTPTGPRTPRVMTLPGLCQTLVMGVTSISATAAFLLSRIRRTSRVRRALTTMNTR